MKTINKIYLPFLIGLFFLNLSLSKAQCSQTPWVACFPSCTYVTGDTVSYSSRDWVVKANTTYTYLAPGTDGGWTWDPINVSCVGTTTPIVPPTEVRGTYCTTTFGIGSITRNGGAAITARGHVFGTSPNPTLSDGVLLDGGVGTGDEFEGLIDNLTPETTYYVRTYATNSQGTRYGTQASLTTKATADCADCNLSCDETDSKWLNPTTAEWSTPAFSTINTTDTVCITEDVTIGGSITLYGMFKICNGATVTLNGNIDVQTATAANPNYEGQVVYEGCTEIFDGTGSYTGEYLNPPGINDPLQMISYCETCDEDDTSQFFKPDVSTAYWGATCRPTSTLLTALPVELKTFSASLTENGVELDWITGSEINNSHFNVQFSYDGINWETIGVVQGMGNSTAAINYSFLDPEQGSGVQYYRLEQVDFDGTTSLSNIKHVTFDDDLKAKAFVAFQNSGNKVEIQTKFSGMGEALLIDTRGRIIETKSFVSTDKSGFKMEFNSTNLAEGVYYVNIKSGNALIGEKVQIVK